MMDYKKYRWFYTSEDTLVVGGKSAEQNDKLLREILETKKEYYVMHTRMPGSPFAIILGDMKKISEKELEECARFTACFSRAWKQGAKKAIVDVFSTKDISKSREMKEGTWSVRRKIKSMEADLKLSLIKQKGVLRAVPYSSGKSFATICPGKLDKQQLSAKLEVIFGDEFKNEEIIMALPSGSSRIIK